MQGIKQFYSMQKRKKQYSVSTANSYGRNRLDSLNLTHEDGFEPCSETGDIIIQYHSLNGDRAYYHKLDSRSTAAIEAPERFRNRKPYKARRISPERLTGKDNKYNRPAAAAIPFIPLQVRQLYKSSKACTLALFTEGEVKAAYIAKNFQIPAVAFAGISNYKLNADIKQLLRVIQPPKLVLNYDSDALKADDKSRLASFYSSAFSFALELRTFYILQGLQMPKLYICIQNPNQPHKGIDDLLQSVGKQAAAELRTCQTSEYFTFLEVHPDKVYKCLSDFFNYSDSRLKNYNGLLLRADFYSDKESKIRTRLTDILHANILPLTSIFGKLWDASTGIGKTTAIIKAAALEKVAFFAPMLVMVDQVYNDAIAAGIDVIKYAGDDKAEQQHLADRLNSCNLPQMIVCTYASAESLNNMLTFYTKVYHLVIDEFHSTTTATSAGYMLKQLNGLLDTACNYRTITGFTGTPLLNLHPVTKDLQQVTIKLTGEPKTATEFIQAADMLQAAAITVQGSIEEGRLPMVLFNNKKEGLDDLLYLLKDTAGITGIKMFNADTKNSPEFIELIQSGMIGKDVTAAICTTVLELGINNNSTTPTDVIILGQFHPANIKQFKERNRLSDCRLFIIQKEKTEPTSARFVDRDAEAVKLIRQAEKVCSILNEDGACPYVIAIRQNLQSVYIRETAAGFIPDYLAIQNYIFETEKQFLNSSPERLLKALSKYGFDCYTDETLNIKTTKVAQNADAKLRSKIRKECNKADKAELFSTIAAELQGTGLPQLTAERAIKAKDTTDQAKDFYTMFLDIREHCKTDQQAAELFKHTDGKRSKVKLTILRLKTKRAIFDSHDIGKAPAAILNDFAAGQRMTAEQLKNAFIACIKIDPTIDIEPFEKAKRIDSVLKRLRMFFDVISFGDGGTDYLIQDLPPIYI
jgi:hypothetical protein